MVGRGKKEKVVQSTKSRILGKLRLFLLISEQVWETTSTGGGKKPGARKGLSQDFCKRGVGTGAGRRQGNPPIRVQNSLSTSGPESRRLFSWGARRR